MEAMREPDAGAAFPSDTRDERARCSGTVRAPYRLRGTARRWTYAAGDEIRVTVRFSETVVVTGSPQLRLELGGGRRTATYEGGSGTAAPS